jgi:lipid II:glycine glycyltransferase (peptidoglycan interpeptide bridge formation enzyme)
LLIKWILFRQSELGQSYVELRTRFKGDLFKASKFKEFNGYKNHTLCISPNKEELIKTFNRTCVRQRINRAEKTNITVKEASSEADVRIFYELHCLTRKKYGVPVQPYKFFKNMWEILHPKNMFGVFIARHEAQPVSALLFLKFKKRVHAEYMGTNDAFLKYSPNILLFWKAILKSKTDGYQNFDFGGSQADNIPLIKFKRRWGTVEENLVHYYFPEIRGLSAGFERSKKFSVLTQLCQKMPVPLFKWAGNRLYCHFGG